MPLPTFIILDLINTARATVVMVDSAGIVRCTKGKNSVNLQKHWDQQNEVSLIELRFSQIHDLQDSILLGRDFASLGEKLPAFRITQKDSSSASRNFNNVYYVRVTNKNVRACVCVCVYLMFIGPCIILIVE